MRQDVYKSLVSADPIAIRLPYAIITQMVELSGWAGFELVTLMNFSGVEENSFDSIMRRSCISQFKGQFASANRIRQPDGAAACAQIKVFFGDPTLRAFVKGKLAAHAFLHAIRGFAHKHSLD